MDNAEIAVLVGGVGLIIGVLWYFFGARDKERALQTTGGPIYACPMHPWIQSDDAATNCSICGMKLVLHKQSVPTPRGHRDAQR